MFFKDHTLDTINDYVESVRLNSDKKLSNDEILEKLR